MSDSLFIAMVILMFIFLTIVVIKADKKPKYEIKYSQGRYIIIETITGEYIMWFVTFEDAQDWFNKNCKDV